MSAWSVPFRHAGPVPETFLTNGQIGELLWRAGEAELAHRKQALERAARAARFWPEEAADLARTDRSLTELRAVGPWVARRIHEWLDDPPPPVEPDAKRGGFLTYAEVRRVLDTRPEWEATPHGDLQVHSTDSDGALPLADMASVARALGRTFIASTDHSKSLKIAHGMDEAQLAEHNRVIDELNSSFERSGDAFRVLRSIEMDVLEDGSGDMEPAALATLDLVLGAFHTKLRVTDDVTDRYLAALRNPTVHILAHPVARMYGRRVGLSADWPRVFDEAARLGKALEIDATPSRQDLSVELARIAVASGVRWFSIGSDAHSATELEFLSFGFAIAALAGVAEECVLNYRTPEEVIAWASEIRGR
jgi:histidinol phosphatase-like PHP family hydrolase